MKSFLKENLKVFHIIVYLLLIFLQFVDFIKFENFNISKDFEKFKSLIYLKIMLGYFPIFFIFILGFFIRKNIMKDNINFSTYIFSIIMCTLQILIMVLPLTIIIALFSPVFLSSFANNYEIDSVSLINNIIKAISFPLLIFLYGIYSVAMFKINGDYKVKEAFYVFKKPIFKETILIAIITFIIPLIIQFINTRYKFSNIANTIVIIYEYFSLLINFYFTMYLVSYLNNYKNINSRTVI